MVNTTMGPQATIDFAIWAPLVRDDLPGLNARVCRLLAAADPVVAFCDVSGFGCVDAVTVDALARLALVAGRRGCQVRLRDASPQLRDLVTLMGLADVLRAE